MYHLNDVIDTKEAQTSGTGLESYVMYCHIVFASQKSSRNHHGRLGTIADLGDAVALITVQAISIRISTSGTLILSTRHNQHHQHIISLRTCLFPSINSLNTEYHCRVLI
jgi:hypothetical protein